MPRLFHLTLLVPALLVAGCAQKRDASEASPVYNGDAPASSAPARESDAVGTTSPDASGGQAAPRLAERLDATADTTGSGPAPAAAQAVAPQMIIRTGTATVRVDSLELAMARVERLARTLGGYVANTSVQTGSENLRQASMELKIPAARWTQAVSGLAPIGKLESQQTATEDVGEEYVDVTARMTNARRLESRLLELLAARTGKLDDVLAVERELARVREEIERSEGRLRFLRTRAAVSTLTVQLHEPSPLLSPGRSPIVGAFGDAWLNFVGFTAALISSLGWLIPLLLVIAGLIWILRRLFPRRTWFGAPRGGAAPGAPVPPQPPYPPQPPQP